LILVVVKVEDPRPKDPRDEIALAKQSAIGINTHNSFLTIPIIRNMFVDMKTNQKKPQVNFENSTNIGYFYKNQLAMSKNTSITFGTYFEQFIQNTLKEGRYKNASEIVRAGLRLLEEEESKLATLRHSINEGIASGTATDFNPNEHLKKLKSIKK
jgi:antitoxin ParD1/3/4